MTQATTRSLPRPLPRCCQDPTKTLPSVCVFTPYTPPGPGSGLGTWKGSARSQDPRKRKEALAGCQTGLRRRTNGRRGNVQMSECPNQVAKGTPRTCAQVWVGVFLAKRNPKGLRMTSKAAYRRAKLATLHPGQLCGARVKGRPGGFCRRTVTPGHFRCHYHGSRSTGPKPRFDAEGNRIIPNFEAWQAGRDRYWECRRAAKLALAAAGLKDEWPPV
jgi:hypothetical protein